MKKEIDGKVVEYKLLKDCSKLEPLAFGEKEGERFINISPKSTSKLGKMLAPTTPSYTKLFCGKVACIKRFMEAIKTPNYPMEFLTKPHLNASERHKIPKEIIKLPNYWALVAYAVVERVRQDVKLSKLLLENNLSFTILGKEETVEFLDKKILCARVNNAMGAYVGIIRNIELMLKEDTFKDKKVTDEFILKCRDDIEKDIMDSICIPFEPIKKKEEK